MLEKAYLWQKKKQATQNTLNVKLSFSFDFKIHLIKIKQIYRVRPKKRRKLYLRYLCLDLNKTKTGINHFKNTKHNIDFFLSHSRSDDSQLCFFKYLGIFFYSDFERYYFSEYNDMPHVRMYLTVTPKINQ
jgi:hypothetical protein